MIEPNIKKVIENHLLMFKQGMFTSIPAKVLDYDATTLTITAEVIVPSIFKGKLEPAIKLHYVPVIFPSAGGGMISFPVNEGDTVMLVFSMRDISEWKQGDGSRVETPSPRTHNLNDAIAIVGLFAQEQDKPNIPTDAVKIQYGDSEVTLEKTKVIINTSGTVEVGDGAESLLKSSAFVSLFNTHTHAVPSLGTSAVPTVLIEEATVKTSILKGA